MVYIISDANKKNAAIGVAFDYFDADLLFL